MANDKDFLVNGPVVVGKDTKVTVGSIAAGTVDLSTGNYFVDTPSGDYTYTFANPGNVQAFQIQATGGSDAVAETFSTTLYTGNGSTQTITNGLDLAGDGGLVWVKQRDAAFNNILIDTERGVSNFLYSDQTNAQETYSGYGVTSFNSDGFAVTDTTVYGVNKSAATYASWSFKKQTKFFDVVTWTGDGTSNRSISHNLDVTVGTLIVKRVDSTSDWWVWHRSLANTELVRLNLTNAKSTGATARGSTTPTSSNFTVNSYTNTSGATYVAYLFAHDTASDGLIQCGSYTGTGGSGVSVNLGWQPQWVLVKRATGGTADWHVWDNQRGIVTDGNDNILFPNSSAAENTTLNRLDVSSTGFEIPPGNNPTVDNVGDTYIYMAIRAAAAPAITWPTNIEWTGGSTPSTPAEGETDVYTFTTDDGGTTYTGIHSIDNAS